MKSTLIPFDRYAEKFGFKKIEKKKESIEKGIKKTIIETVIGSYKDSNNYCAFVHATANRELLGEKLFRLIISLKKTTAVYEGENYLFLSIKNDAFAFDLKLYQNIINLISEINEHTPFFIKEYQISSDGILAGLLMNDHSLFLIAQILGYKQYIDEERILLVRKIGSAQAFFNFEPYKKINWSKLKSPQGEHFESLCEIILSKQENITEIQPFGKTNASDRGRDFIVTEKSIDIDGKSRKINWLEQCKFSKNSISTKHVPDWTNRIIEHHLDGYWLITNNDLTPDLQDQLKDSEKNIKMKIETRIWQRNKFDAIYNTHPELFTVENFQD